MLLVLERKALSELARLHLPADHHFPWAVRKTLIKRALIGHSPVRVVKLSFPPLHSLEILPFKDQLGLELVSALPMLQVFTKGAFILPRLLVQDSYVKGRVPTP